jgi:hypothetical protein
LRNIQNYQARRSRVWTHGTVKRDFIYTVKDLRVP